MDVAGSDNERIEREGGAADLDAQRKLSEKQEAEEVARDKEAAKRIMRARVVISQQQEIAGL